MTTLSQNALFRSWIMEWKEGEEVRIWTAEGLKKCINLVMTMEKVTRAGFFALFSRQSFVKRKIRLNSDVRKTDIRRHSNNQSKIKLGHTRLWKLWRVFFAIQANVRSCHYARLWPGFLTTHSLSRWYCMCSLYVPLSVFGFCSICALFQKKRIPSRWLWHPGAKSGEKRQVLSFVLCGARVITSNVMYVINSGAWIPP